ncbi:unnamed protein product [Amoebophrya sp. A120]|nr:unnamed protein product [Amoebophrya sp. A120]|eukprot:GSA120T00001384001.1
MPTASAIRASAASPAIPRAAESSGGERRRCRRRKQWRHCHNASPGASTGSAKDVQIGNPGGERLEGGHEKTERGRRCDRGSPPALKKGGPYLAGDWMGGAPAWGARARSDSPARARALLVAVLPDGRPPAGTWRRRAERAEERPAGVEKYLCARVAAQTFT